MSAVHRKESLVLFLGDIAALYLSLSITLFLRSLFPFQGTLSYAEHSIPFSILIAVWLAVFFIAGMYEKHTVIFKRHLPIVLLKTQTINSIIAVIFFYFIPYLGIAPKTNLFIYIFVSLFVLSAWRLYGINLFGLRRREKAALIGTGEEMEELYTEINGNSRYGFKFSLVIDTGKRATMDSAAEVSDPIRASKISLVVIDMASEKARPLMPHLYSLLFSGVRFVDMHEIYEEIFDRVPLPLIGYRWFVENLSLARHGMYDALKRVMDITIALPLAIFSLAIYPFVYAALKLQDGGVLFSHQERVGQNNRPIMLLKFRTMDFDDAGKWSEGPANRVTSVGRFLRTSRIDELPQLWNVIKGDISLIGPRPEFPDPVKLYNEQIPYYDVRHLIKPGLSGWAQIHHERHPHHGIDVAETANKLSYDLYYIKNRSFMLDLVIALRTIQTLISRTGV